MRWKVKPAAVPLNPGITDVDDLSSPYEREVRAMIDRFWRRFVAAVAMVACCGASMAIALGVVVVSSTVLIGGIAAVAGLGCVVAMSALGHGRARATHASNPDTDASSVSA